MRRLDILNALAMALSELLGDEHKTIDAPIIAATVEHNDKQYRVEVREVTKASPKQQADKFLNGKPKVQI